VCVRGFRDLSSDSSSDRERERERKKKSFQLWKSSVETSHIYLDSDMKQNLGFDIKKDEDMFWSVAFSSLAEYKLIYSRYIYIVQGESKMEIWGRKMMMMKERYVGNGL